MKVRAIAEFVDKFDNSIKYVRGTELDFDENRANDLINRGLAVSIEPAKPKKVEPTKEEPKKVVKKATKK